MKHTPTHWKVDEKREGVIHSHDNREWTLGWHASEVVKRYNAHDELVDVLKALLTQCEKVEVARCQTFDDCDRARVILSEVEAR